MAENETVKTTEEALPEDAQATKFTPLEELEIVD